MSTDTIIITCILEESFKLVIDVFLPRKTAELKSAYKNLLTGILELHVILLVAAILLALVCVGEIASCGLIFLIATQRNRNRACYRKLDTDNSKCNDYC